NFSPPLSAPPPLFLFFLPAMALSANSWSPRRASHRSNFPTNFSGTRPPPPSRLFFPSQSNLTIFACTQPGSHRKNGDEFRCTSLLGTHLEASETTRPYSIRLRSG